MKIVSMNKQLMELANNELVSNEKGIIEWKRLNKKYKFSKYFKDNYINYYAFNTTFSWYYLATGINLPEDFIRLNYNKLIKCCFGAVLCTSNISLEFIREYKDIFTNDNWNTLLHSCWIVAKYLRTNELRDAFYREFSKYITEDDINRGVSEVLEYKNKQLDCVGRFLIRNNLISLNN